MMQGDINVAVERWIRKGKCRANLEKHPASSSFFSAEW